MGTENTVRAVKVMSAFELSNIPYESVNISADSDGMFWYCDVLVRRATKSQHRRAVSLMAGDGWTQWDEREHMADGTIANTYSAYHRFIKIDENYENS